VAFKYKDLVGRVAVRARGPRPWFALAEGTDQPHCEPATRKEEEEEPGGCAAGEPTFCTGCDTNTCGQPGDDDDHDERQAADLALLKAELRQALAQGL
jgi:hypothetical protein